MRDMIAESKRSDRRICDIGDHDIGEPKMPEAKPNFCEMEHEELKDAGYKRYLAGSISYTNDAGVRHHSPGRSTFE